MNFDSAKSCMLSLKTKNSEGFERIPQRILIDGANMAFLPLNNYEANL